MTHLYQVDAFTDRPFAGNPAAVCPLPSAPDAAWMQAVASEMNLSETAFLWRQETGWRLRWFTPVAEVELCGHATLASAHILWTTGLADGDTLDFDTASGRLTARRNEPRIVLDFPAVESASVEEPDGLGAALGAEPVGTWRGRWDLLVELPSAAGVLGLAPDFKALAEIDARGILVTAPADGDDDFVSRFFAPRLGIDEDPVTGSAHCQLAPFWSRRLGRSRLRAYQASARGGRLVVEDLGDRVLLEGRAVTVLEGTLTAPADAP